MQSNEQGCRMSAEAMEMCLILFTGHIGLCYIFRENSACDKSMVEVQGESTRFLVSLS